MKIRVGFSTTDGPWSKLICWFTEAEVSHTYIRLYDEYLEVPIVIHADLPGLVVEHAVRFDQHNYVIEEFEIEDERLKESFKKNLHQLRKKYNWWDILSWAFVLKFKRWFKRKVRDPLEDPKKLICVDWVVGILNDAEIPNLHFPLGTLHPRNLRYWFNQNYKKFGWTKIVNESRKE